MSKRVVTSAVATGLTAFALASAWENSGEMKSAFDQFSADSATLNRMYVLPESEKRFERFTQFYSEWMKALEKVNFNALPTSGRADWLILKNKCEYELADLKIEQIKLIESQKLAPFWPSLVNLVHSRILKSIPEPQEAAKTVAQLEKEIQTATEAAKTASVPEPVARRVVEMTSRGRERVKEWYEHYEGYDPLFTWWVKNPYTQLDKALAAYREQVNQTYFKGKVDAKSEIKGDPIGQSGFDVELKHEMISYTVPELIAIGKKEMEWCDQELKKAARDLGFKDDWKAALEHVKTLHGKPGEQPTIVSELAQEAIDYLDENNLLTIPDLAKETWRLTMMSPERQLISPFFLGGETIIVSFPTDEMTHEQKLMSMRANNRYFSKATVHHELIPGHHMQFFMNSRFNTHRQGVSNTPFWVEGWALYWEFYFYKQKFAATPEERLGFLFWRKHRAARIVFSLSYHLGTMSAEDCIKMLVDEVQHEQSTAEGEVRRSLEGTYPPLYQAAYMLGAFQMWELRQELVETGKMTDREFHDAILQIGNLPFALVRAILKDEKLTKDFNPKWNFYKGSIESPWQN